MRHAVADASFCGAWILADEPSEKSEYLLSQIVQGKVELVAPSLLHYEMNNLLHSAHKRRRLSEEDAREALETLNQVPLTIEDLPEGPARKRILHLALQSAVVRMESSSFFSLLFTFLSTYWGDQGGVSFLLRFSLACGFRQRTR